MLTKIYKLLLMGRNPFDLTHDYVNELEQENISLKDVLGFYADESNYDGWTDPDYQWTGEAKHYESDIEGDLGELARNILEELNDTTDAG